MILSSSNTHKSKGAAKARGNANSSSRPSKQVRSTSAASNTREHDIICTASSDLESSDGEEAGTAGNADDDDVAQLANDVPIIFTFTANREVNTNVQSNLPTTVK